MNDDEKCCCGNCLHHRPSWETGHLSGWHCDNFMADAYGCDTEYDDGEECPDFKARGRQTMWKIFIEYDDKSKLTITGKHKDIPVELANKYYREYVKSSVCNATYQQYPKKDHKPMSLATKIMELQKGA